LEDEHTILLCLPSHAHSLSFGARLPVAFLYPYPTDLAVFHHGCGTLRWDIGKHIYMARILLNQLRTQHAKDAIPRNGHP
jgi:hypothetical protein